MIGTVGKNKQFVIFASWANNLVVRPGRDFTVNAFVSFGIPFLRENKKRHENENSNVRCVKIYFVYLTARHYFA